MLNNGLRDGASRSMDILIIAILTLLNGAFAMSEMAVSASKRLRLVALSESGDHGAAKALQLMDNPTRFLSTVQIGITSIGMLNGIVGEAAFADGLSAYIQSYGVREKAANLAATGIVVTVITFTTIIFGELVPKRIGQMYPELVARRCAVPMSLLAKAAAPFVALLSATTSVVIQLLRIKAGNAHEVTEDDIQAQLKEGVEAGVIEETEHQLVRNVFHLDDRTLTSLMVPRADVRYFDATDSIATTLLKIRTDAQTPQENLVHNHYPVCKGDLGNIIGTVSLQTLALAVDESKTLEQVVEPATFAPETLTGMELLEQFRTRVPKLVLVVDEYGEFQGLVAPHDMLQAITGELQTANLQDRWAQQAADGSWTIDGAMPIAEFKARLGISEDLPDEGKARYSSVAGLVMLLAEHVPQQGDKVVWRDWGFEVLATEGRRVVSVRAIQS